MVHNDTDRQFFVDIDVQSKIEFTTVKIKIFIEVLVEESNIRSVFTNQIIDFCSLISHMPSNWQMKVLFGDLNRFPNIPKSCPIIPGHYFANKFTANVEYFPMKVIPKMTFFCSMDFYTIIQKRKAFLTNLKFEIILKNSET